MISLVLAAAVSWPLQYNAGVTAYRSNDFSGAVSQFEEATASKDRALQGRAYYNLGNTAYRLGEADPTKAQLLWERAVKNYETVLAIDPNDSDAKFNRDFVKKKIEELKKQQQQQQQQQQNQKNRDQRKKDQEQKQDQQKNDQQQKQEQQQKQDQQQQQQQSQQDQQKQQQQQEEGKKDEKEQKQEQKPSKPEEQKDQQPQQAQAGNLEKQQAKALLDNMREDERNWNFFPEVQMKDLKDSGPPAKDW
jgi:Ca-activated chloride channel homolog